MNLDKKDWKILSFLSQDCRISLTQLAKRVKTSREVADYRVKRLVKNGIIKYFCTDINLEILSYTKHVVYLELINVDKNKEQEIFNILKKNTYVSWLVTSTGKWSVIFDIHSKNTQHLAQLIKEIKNSLPEHIGEYEIATLENYAYYHSKFFGEKSINKKKIAKNIKLDQTDLFLLKILRNNARLDYVELSKKINLTPEAISKRIKRLKENSIINQFYIFPDITKLGFEHYNMQINLGNINAEREKNIMSYLEQHNSVSFIYRPISHWDIEFGVFVKNPGELRKFMQDLRTFFSENIRIKDVSLFYEELTGNFLPEGIF